MLNPNEIASELPAPRDDEPRELRRDIADELADHLRCAVRREQLRDDQAAISEQAALAAAIERFGNPAAVARRLWWDATKEKIMTQRILSVLVAAAVAMSVLSCVFMWQMLRSGREAQAALLESQREAMAALIAEIRAPREAVAVADEANNWQPLRVKLIDEAGRPVEGTIRVSGKPMNSDETISASAGTADGIADLGRLPIGQYTLHVTVKSTDESTSAPVLLRPGHPDEVTIECPTSTPSAIPFRFEIDSPENLKSEPLYYFAQVQVTGSDPGVGAWTRNEVSRNFSGRKWTRMEVLKFVFLLDSSGKVLGEVAPSNPNQQAFLQSLFRSGGGGGFGGGGGGFPEGGFFTGGFVAGGIPLRHAQGLLPGEYYFVLKAFLPNSAGGKIEGKIPASNRMIYTYQGQFNLTENGAAIAYRIAPTDADFWGPVNEILHPPPEDPPVTSAPSTSP